MFSSSELKFNSSEHTCHGVAQRFHLALATFSWHWSLLYIWIKPLLRLKGGSLAVELRLTCGRSEPLLKFTWGFVKLYVSLKCGQSKAYLLFRMFFLLFCILFMYAQERVYALVYTHIRKCVHIYYNVWSIILLTLCGLFVKILLKYKVFLGKVWLFRKFVVLLHSLLRNQAFLKAIKERVLWKILHKQTSSTRSGFELHLII